jgi:PAS domain S-box-containing protein
VLFPLLAFAGVLIWHDVTRQYDVHRDDTLDTAHALSLAVDREWAALQAILQTLATSTLLDAEDWRAFYNRCARAAASYPGAWIVLFEPTGQQVINTFRPFGAALPNPLTASETQPPARAGELPVADLEALHRAFQTAKPTYSNLFMGIVSKHPTISLNVPVLREGRVVYVLTMALFPETFTRLLQERGRSADSTSSIMDRRGMIIARSAQPEQFVGRPTTFELPVDPARGDEGWGYGRTWEQVPVYYAWTRSPATGWITAISVTEASITGPIRRSLTFWGSGAILALALGLGLAWLVARRITAPIAALTRSADLVQRGQAFAMPPVAVQEVQHLYAALVVMADAMRQQAAERERRLIVEAEAAERQRAAAVLAEVNATLRQAEAAERMQRDWWQTTLASIGDAVIVTDTAGRISFLNDMAAMLTGWPLDEATGRPLTEVFQIMNEHTRQPVEPPVARVLRDGHVVGLANHTLLWRRDGSEVPIDDSAAPIRGPQDTMRGVVLVFRDITARKQAEQTLQQAHNELERRVEERTAALRHAMAEHQRLEQEARRAEHFALLGRLAAGVSHEIRNPLGAVFLYVEVLEEELRAPSPDSLAVVAEAFAEIKTNLARLDDLVQDYLSLVRVGHIQREVQDLGAAVQAWGAEMQQDVAARGVTLQMQDLASLGPIAFHANTLRRALLNLVQNAADAMPQGGTVTLAGQGMATQVQLLVQDTGDGIPAERLGQIFEPLYTTKPGGTGLGLYIVQEIVAAHGGQITMQSVVGQGTTCTLTLPRTLDAFLPASAQG